MIRRSSWLVTLALLAGPAALAAQSSQFGVRGLGLPIRPQSPRATGTGGAFGLFDTESSINPALPASMLNFTALLTSMQNFRHSTNPFGTASGRDNRFPQMQVAGPIGGTRLGLALSVSGYTDRSFSLGTQDTVDLRGQRIGVYDTLTSRGGISDIQAAVGWRVSKTLTVGIGLHALPGSNRVENHRAFADSSFSVAIERADLSYLGFGVSAGFLLRVVPRLTLAGTFRTDTHASVERDSTLLGNVDLPTQISAGLRWQTSLRSAMAVSYSRRSWSGADAGLKALGGIGALDTYEVAAGMEFLKDLKNAGHKPLRFGGHYATLPFPVVTGRQAHELGVALGTGLRFTGGRGGVDLSLEQLWRSDGQSYTERATVISLGVSIRP
jgi:hypothetical protein